LAKVGVSPQPQTSFGDDSPVLLSTVLLRVRNAHGWTRAEVSKRTGLSSTSIQRLESDACKPRLRTLKAYLEGLLEGEDGISEEEADEIADASGVVLRARRKEEQPPPPLVDHQVPDRRHIDPDEMVLIVRLSLDLLIQAGPARTMAALESLIKATTKATPISAGRQAGQTLRSISAPITRPDGATEHVIRTYEVARIPPPAPAKKKAN